MPEADKLALLREEIDQHSDRLKTVLRRADMRREIFDGIPDKDEAAVEAFGESNKESALKVRPKVRLLSWIFLTAAICRSLACPTPGLSVRSPQSIRIFQVSGTKQDEFNKMAMSS